MSSSINVSDLTWSAANCPPLFAQLNLCFGPIQTGLVGRNGVGKTTLLRLITGELQPQTGNVSCSGRLGVLRQIVQVRPDQTVAELFRATEALTILRRAERGAATVQELAVVDWTLESRIAAALDRVKLKTALKTPLTALSGGQRTRAGLAALLFEEPDFLLLDEPTNNLDREGREAVIELLADWRYGAIVVSHDRELLENMSAIIELTTLGATRYGGNWSEYREQKAQELAAFQKNLADAEKRVADVNRSAQMTAERYARRSSRGKKNGERGGIPHIILGGMKERSENTGGQNELLAERRRDQAMEAAATARERIEVLQPLTVELHPTNLPANKVVLRLDQVTAGYQPGHPIIQDLSFTITGPERIAVTGPNGSGKTTLLSLITKQLNPWSGSIDMLTTVAMLDQQMTLLNASASVRDNFLRLNPGTNEQTCRAALARFMFRADAALQVVSTLSGGQLLRAGLVCVLNGPTPPPFLILDEPTNHLDIDSIEAVEAGLKAYDGALLVVSHDETFLNAIGITRRLTLRAAFA